MADFIDLVRQVRSIGRTSWEMSKRQVSHCKS